MQICRCKIDDSSKSISRVSVLDGCVQSAQAYSLGADLDVRAQWVSDQLLTPGTSFGVTPVIIEVATIGIVEMLVPIGDCPTKYLRRVLMSVGKRPGSGMPHLGHTANHPIVNQSSLRYKLYINWKSTRQSAVVQLRRGLQYHT